MKADARLNRLQCLFGKIRQFGRRLDFGAGFYKRLIDGAESEFQFLVLPCRSPAFTEFDRDLFLAMLKFSLRRERFLQPDLQPAQLRIHRLNMDSNHQPLPCQDDAKRKALEKAFS